MSPAGASFKCVDEGLRHVADNVLLGWHAGRIPAGHTAQTFMWPPWIVEPRVLQPVQQVHPAVRYISSLGGLQPASTFAASTTLPNACSIRLLAAHADARRLRNSARFRREKRDSFTGKKTDAPSGDLDDHFALGVTALDRSHCVGCPVERDDVFDVRIELAVADHRR